MEAYKNYQMIGGARADYLKIVLLHSLSLSILSSLSYNPANKKIFSSSLLSKNTQITCHFHRCPTIQLTKRHHIKEHLHRCPTIQLTKMALFFT